VACLFGGSGLVWSGLGVYGFGMGWGIPLRVRRVRGLFDSAGGVNVSNIPTYLTRLLLVDGDLVLFYFYDVGCRCLVSSATYSVYVYYIMKQMSWARNDASWYCRRCENQTRASTPSSWSNHGLSSGARFRALVLLPATNSLYLG
jgi:hypothetical protein